MDSIAPLKHCIKCATDKPLDEFGIERKRPDGHAVYCKTCRRAMANDRYQRDPDVRSIAVQRSGERARRLKDDPIFRKQAREGSQRYIRTEKGKRANREKIKRLRQTSPTIRNYFKQYEKKRRENDPEFLKRWRAYKRQKARDRRAHEKGAMGSYTEAEWIALCEKYDHRCLRCGKQVTLTRDHIRPVTKDGSNTIDNIQPLCKPCNSWKGTKTIDYRY